VRESVLTKESISEKDSRNEINTVVLYCFDRRNGLEALMKLTGRYIDRISELKPLLGDGPKDQAESLKLVHVFGGLRVMFTLLQSFSSGKLLTESTQTAILTLKDRDGTNGAVTFDPSTFLVHIRLLIFPTVLAVWEQPWLRDSPPNFVRTIIKIWLNIIKAEWEIASPSSSFNIGSFGGNQGSWNLPSIPAQRITVPDEARVTQLTDMGFPRSAAESALARRGNNVPAAAEYLLTHPGMVAEARDAERIAALTETANTSSANPTDNNAPSSQDASEPNPTTATESQPPLPSAGETSSNEVEPPNESRTEPTGLTVEVPVGEVSTPSGIDGEGDVEMNGHQDEEEEAAKDVEMEETDSRKGKSKASDATVKLEELNLLRKQLKQDFIPKAIELSAKYSDIIFELKEAFGLDEGEKEKNFERLVSDQKEAIKNEKEINESIFTIKQRLLALLTNDPHYQLTFKKQISNVLALTLEYLEKFLADTSKHQSSLPVTLLIAESILRFTNQLNPTEYETLGASFFISQGLYSDFII
jgi:E3 ubiquitin-protein ligase HUWE1